MCLRAAGDRCDGYGAERLPQRARISGLAWSGAAAEFDRGQGRLGGISERGKRYLRRLLINGASANLLHSRRRRPIHT